MRRLTTDVTQIEFSLEMPGGPELWGQIDISLVRRSKDVRNLLSLSHLLVDYCRANQRDKPNIEHAIERTAVQLAAAR